MRLPFLSQPVAIVVLFVDIAEVKVIDGADRQR